MAAPAPAPVQPPIDVQNPTPAYIQAAIARVPASVSSAGYFFNSKPRGPGGVPDPAGLIDQQFILQTLKNIKKLKEKPKEGTKNKIEKWQKNKRAKEQKKWQVYS